MRLQVLLILPFLQLEIHFTRGELEQSNSIIQKDNEQDVYEVNDPNGGSEAIRLVYPKHEKAVLREIVYYHVIEKPYWDEGDYEEDSANSKSRLFTNSHAGMDFLPGPTVDSFSDVVNETEKDANNKTNQDSNVKKETDEVPKTTTEVTEENQKEKENPKDLSRIQEINKKEYKDKEPPTVRRKRNVDYENIPEPPTLDLIEAPADFNNPSLNDQNSTDDMVIIPKMATKPKTYGMSLSNGNSFIWNNLLPQRINNATNDADQVKSTEEPPMNKYSEEVIDTNNLDLDDIVIKNGYRPTNNPVNVSSPELNNDQDPDDLEYDDDIDDTKDINDVGSDTGDEDSDEDLDNVTLDELIHNKQFWEWLSSWMEAYVQTVKKHIKNYIEEEVSRQIENKKNELYKNLKVEQTPNTNTKYNELTNYCTPDCIRKSQIIHGDTVGNDKVTNMFFIYPSSTDNGDKPDMHIENMNIADNTREDMKPQHVEEFNKVFKDKITNLIISNKPNKSNTEINNEDHNR